MRRLENGDIEFDTPRTAEIRALHAELLEAHLRTPEQRLGQLVQNMLHTSTTAQWNIRDSRWRKLIRAWAR